MPQALVKETRQRRMGRCMRILVTRQGFCMAVQVDLSQKVAIVTGGGRGIGRAIAVYRLADAGADVCVTARTAAQIQETSDLVLAKGEGR
jgi:shikimate 5-dehydrogenase